MKVVLFGASGMVGSGTLLECLDDARVSSVLVIGRSATGVTHPKLQELLHRDFFDYSLIQPRLSGWDACFFCLGVSSNGMNEDEYRRLTFDLTMAAARALLAGSPGLSFCFVSGAGTDSSEQGRLMWARIKGKTENALLAMPFKAAWMFRPGFIQPLRGVRSKTPLYQLFILLAAPLFPLLRRLFPRQVTTTVELGRAMIEVVDKGYEKRILDPEDINRLARPG
jgi:uncharacterized protein YbjT (DUF2867 family)